MTASISLFRDKHIKLVNLLKNVEFSLILQIQQQKENQIHSTEGAKSAVSELKCSTGPTEVPFWLLKAAKEQRRFSSLSQTCRFCLIPQTVHLEQLFRSCDLVPRAGMVSSQQPG